MSIAALNWAFEQKVGSASLKLVLIIMADHTNDKQGWECWPCAKAIEEISGLNRKTVQRCMDKLREMGVLTDTGKRSGATGQVKVYRFNIEQAQKRDSLKPEAKRPKNDLKEAQFRATEPLEPLNSSLRSDSPAPESLFVDEPIIVSTVGNFAEFYATYPRRTAKLAAEKAYLKALKKGVPHDRILAAAKAYAVICTGKDPAYVKHPATWLNGGCWDDEQPAGGQFPPSGGGSQAGGYAGGRREPTSVVDAALRVAARYSS